jgi:aspartate kinase
MEALRVSANKEISKIVLQGVPDKAGIAAEIFGTLGAQGFNVELVVSTGGTRGTADICLAVAKTQEAQIRQALERMKGDTLAGEIVSDSSVALVSVTGQNLAKVPGVAGRMFRALSSKGINIEIISTSLASVTCMIPRDRTEEALAALEGEFLSERVSG